MRRFLLAFVVVCAVGISGCSLFRTVVPVLSTATAVAQDASTILSLLQTASDAWFAGRPNPTLEEKVRKGISDAKLGLLTAIRTANGATELDAGDADNAFADFRAAYANLVSLLKSIGIVGVDGMVGISTGEKVSVPSPLAFHPSSFKK